MRPVNTSWLVLAQDQFTLAINCLHQRTPHIGFMMQICLSLLSMITKVWCNFDEICCSCVPVGGNTRLMFQTFDFLFTKITCYHLSWAVVTCLSHVCNRGVAHSQYHANRMIRFTQSINQSITCLIITNLSRFVRVTWSKFHPSWAVVLDSQHSQQMSLLSKLSSIKISVLGWWYGQLAASTAKYARRTSALCFLHLIAVIYIHIASAHAPPILSHC